MISRLAFSFENYIAAATLTPSSEDPGYPAIFAKRAGRPWNPFKTLATGDQSLQANLGSAKTPRVLYLNRVNFDTAQLQANTSPTWTSPLYTLNLTIKQNPWNWRYQIGVLLPANLTFQYWRLLIPSQTPLELNIYYLGGWWLGPVVFPPSHFQFDISRQTNLPTTAADLAAGGSQVTRIGNASTKFTATRITKLDRISPGTNDQVAGWSAIDRQQWTAGRCLMMLAQADSTETYIIDNIGTLIMARQSLIQGQTQVTFNESNGP